MLEVVTDISNRVDSDLRVFGELSSGDYGAFVKFVSITINLLIGVGFSIGIVSIAFSAIKYTLSEGDPDKTKEAWRAFLWGVIASSVSLGAVALKVIVLKIIGVDSTGVSVLESGGY